MLKHMNHMANTVVKDQLATDRLEEEKRLNYEV